MSMTWTDTERQADADYTIGALVLAVAIIAFAAAALAFTSDPATIDGAPVPGDLACDSGEVIARNYHTDTVECVHIGTLD